jgi:hypothetical protein
VSAKLPCGDATQQERQFEILHPGEGEVFAERGRRYLPYLVLTIGCRKVGAAGWHSSTVVFDRAGDRWRAVEVGS